MSRRRHDRNPLGQGAARQRANRRTPHTSRPAPAESAAENPLISVLRPALRSDDPTAFWVAAAPLVTELADLQHHPEELPEGVDLLDTFIEINVAETTALLHMVAAMCPDEDLRSRAQVGLTARRQPMPPQVSGLVQASVTEAVAFSDGAGENLLVELVLPRGVRATLIAYIQWSPAPYVKDAFVVGESLEEITRKYREIMAGEGASLDEVLEAVGPADARARFRQALANTSADVEQSGDWEQWPMLRPFVEFVVGRMPEGGTGYDEDALYGGFSDVATLPVPEQPPWILEDGTDLVEEFTTSAHAVGLERGSALEDLVAYLMILLDASLGDPLGWDPELAEWILSEVLPRVPTLPEAAAAQIPSALPELVAWSLERKGEEPSVIARTLSAIAPLLDEFPARRADPRMRARRLEEQVDFALELEDPTALRLADLALRAGGSEVLAELETAPLPAEKLALEQFPDDLRDLAAEIDTHLVEGVAALLEHHSGSADTDELLTACRRLLVRVAQLDDAVLRRKASTRNTAAAIVSIVARGNDLMGYPPAPLHEKDLHRAFDLRSSPSQRARTLMEAAALPHRFTGVALADPELLLGTARAELRRVRDVLQAE
ncbi:hypothetical protein [Brachybacterium fresconis]|uniref:Uncharacterized protein n=1 Tax=Brachybacterium fresconis TaxID=173363 RepID=A0ABS4YN29_9MICO|nr:hypothetical protein [Brachybacterium fresconis]MBP2410206.1 hypothetical protein [Brachybacterium fresconis]